MDDNGRQKTINMHVRTARGYFGSSAVIVVWYFFGERLGKSLLVHGRGISD